jgi:hypothetical protein
MALATYSGGSIEVGKTAHRDPILARASYDAARILYDAARLPKTQREQFVARRLDALAPGLGRKARRKRDELVANGKAPNQAIFDAMRLAIADRLAQRGIEYIQAAASNIYGADYGLGEDNTARDVGCAITGGTTAILSLIVGAYTAGAGAPIVGAGGGAIAGAIGCNRDALAAQQATADAQSRQAQALVEQARLAAEQEQARLAQTRERNKVLLIAGGGVAVLLVGVIIAFK